MSGKRVRKKLVFIAAVIFVYSLLPLIPFYLINGAEKTVNNYSEVEKLKDNKGVYFSFIVFGDNHSGLFLNDSSCLKEIWHMNREDRFRKVPIDLVLNVGDVTLDGEKSQFVSYKKIQKLIKFPVISARGNHDDSVLFEEFCGPKEFAFSNRNSFFIVLDIKSGELTEEQFSWLDGKLEEGKKYDNIFVVIHKPPFDPYQQEWYNMDNEPWAYRFRKLCAEYKVKMVFSGHKHMFKHAVFDGVDYIVTGGGGMITEIPERDGGYLHYVRVMVNHDYVTYEVRKISPPFWEFLTYYVCKELVYWVRDTYGIGYIFGRNTVKEPLRVKDLNDREYWMEKNYIQKGREYGQR